MKAANGIVLATGDLAPDREDPDSCFTGTATTLNEAELVFGQLETSFATRGTRQAALDAGASAFLAKPFGIAESGNHNGLTGVDHLQAGIVGRHIGIAAVGDNSAGDTGQRHLANQAGSRASDVHHFQRRADHRNHGQ